MDLSWTVTLKCLAAHILLRVFERENPLLEFALWSGQFVKEWSKTIGFLALSSGESELAAVVRSATEGMGLRSILSDFNVCGRVALKSDATAAVGMVHPLGLEKGSTFGCWRVVGSASRSFRKFESLIKSGRTSKVPWTRTVAASHESVQLGVADEFD